MTISVDWPVDMPTDFDLSVDQSTDWEADWSVDKSVDQSAEWSRPFAPSGGFARICQFCHCARSGVALPVWLSAPAPVAAPHRSQGGRIPVSVYPSAQGSMVGIPTWEQW